MLFMGGGDNFLCEEPSKWGWTKCLAVHHWLVRSPSRSRCYDHTGRRKCNQCHYRVNTRVIGSSLKEMIGDVGLVQSFGIRPRKTCFGGTNVPFRC
jgi:hypothetical protein